MIVKRDAEDDRENGEHDAADDEEGRPISAKSPVSSGLRFTQKTSTAKPEMMATTMENALGPFFFFSSIAVQALARRYDFYRG